MKTEKWISDEVSFRAGVVWSVASNEWPYYVSTRVPLEEQRLSTCNYGFLSVNHENTSNWGRNQGLQVSKILLNDPLQSIAKRVAFSYIWDKINQKVVSKKGVVGSGTCGKADLHGPLPVPEHLKLGKRYLVGHPYRIRALIPFIADIPHGVTDCNHKPVPTANRSTYTLIFHPIKFDWFT